MTFFEFSLDTAREEMIDVTARVIEALHKNGMKSGLCTVYCPHTTAAVTVNENADPDVCRDVLLGLSNAFPKLPGFRHDEGNSAAHLKAASVGCSQTLIVEEGKLVLGRWQSVFFCEFDGPRHRTFYVKLMRDR